MSVALEEAPPPFMTESQRNYDTVSPGKRTNPMPEHAGNLDVSLGVDRMELIDHRRAVSPEPCPMG